MTTPARTTRAPQAPRPGRTAAVALAAALAAVLGGCTEPERSAAGSRTESVVAPGRPGEAARTLSPAEAAKRRGSDAPNAADVAYAHAMIEHHRQALVMTALAPERAAATGVRRIAERIAAAQRPEITAMEGWLTTHAKAGAAVGGSGQSHGGSGPHHGAGAGGHGAMPGMATEAQLAELRQARGAAFDALFLKLMITHHQGAVTMATEVLTDGNHVLIEEMANDVIAQQTSEIGRMRAMAR
ncbi:DUF305 domain-containing protein [Streptomyces sp. URMC 123]|uniref:DUF305 domain-containing protein n=1 Tax=Streptomyces sp. URMC 123 TaxID=3423403 RepID=UPI003F1D632D